jgi:tetratricopeptide (TPR) repeat protein
LEWYDAEHRNLTAAVRHAVEHGEDDTAWRLAATLLYYFTVRRPRDEWIQTCAAAIGAARRAGSEPGEAELLDGLATAYCDAGRFPESLNGFRKALDIYRRIGDQLGEAQTQNNLGEAYRRLGRFAAATNAIQRSLTTFRELDDRRHRIVGVNNLGRTYRAQGRLEEGLDCHLRAWELCEQDGIDHHTAASILSDLGEIHLTIGHSDRAIGYYRETLAHRRTLGDRPGEAQTLRDLGRCYQPDSPTTDRLMRSRQPSGRPTDR